MRAGFLLVLCVLAACAATPARAGRFSGELVLGLETSAFTTDAHEGPWWFSTNGNPALWAQTIAPIRQGGGAFGRVHVIVEGELSPPGHFGHLGAYDRMLTVTRVIQSELAVHPSSRN